MRIGEWQIGLLARRMTVATVAAIEEIKKVGQHALQYLKVRFRSWKQEWNVRHSE